MRAMTMVMTTVMTMTGNEYDAVVACGGGGGGGGGGGDSSDSDV